jgi:hypothetical protein
MYMKRGKKATGGGFLIIIHAGVPRCSGAHSFVYLMVSPPSVSTEVFSMARSGSLAALILLLLGGCASLQLEGVDFGWPVESALPVADNNTVEDKRYAVALPVAALAGAEFGDTTALRGATLRVLRNPAGFYFVTGPRFAHVYVFSAGDGVLSEHSRIRVVPEESTPRGLRNPALNQRPPHVELVDEGGIRVLLSDDDVISGGTPEGGRE